MFNSIYINFYYLLINSCPQGTEIVYSDAEGDW